MSNEIVLATQGLTRRFGGLVAVNDVDFDVKSRIFTYSFMYF